MRKNQASTSNFLTNHEAEKIVLGCMALDQNLIRDEDIQATSFSDVRHRQIYSVLADLVEEGLPVNSDTLLGRGGEDMAIAVIGFMDEAVSTDRYLYNKNIIKDLYIKRDIQKHLLSCLSRIETLPTADLIEEIKSIIPNGSSMDGVVSTKVKNAIMRFVAVTDGNFSVTDAYQAVKDVTPVTNVTDVTFVTNQRSAVRMAIRRMVKAGILEKIGVKDGIYRKLDKSVQVMDFLNASTDEFPIVFPLGVHHLSKIYPSNVIIVAGSKSSGKTAFLLNVVRENMGLHKRTAEDIVYMNSEMGEGELRMRLALFRELSLNAWRFTPISRSSNWADLITEEKKIFIVDFLEITDSFWLIAKEIQDIHKKLKNGIAIIAVQKEAGRDLARGGSFSLEKARLYLSLDHGKLKIVDCKAWRDPQNNPRGQIRQFKLAQGSVFVPQGEWMEEESGDGKVRRFDR